MAPPPPPAPQPQLDDTLTANRPDGNQQYRNRRATRISSTQNHDAGHHQPGNGRPPARRKPHPAAVPTHRSSPRRQARPRIPPPAEWRKRCRRWRCSSAALFPDSPATKWHTASRYIPRRKTLKTSPSWCAEFQQPEKLLHPHMVDIRAIPGMNARQLLRRDRGFYRAAIERHPSNRHRKPCQPPRR